MGKHLFITTLNENISIDLRDYLNKKVFVKKVDNGTGKISFYGINTINAIVLSKFEIAGKDSSIDLFCLIDGYTVTDTTILLETHGDHAFTMRNTNGVQSIYDEVGLQGNGGYAYTYSYPFSSISVPTLTMGDNSLGNWGNINISYHTPSKTGFSYHLNISNNGTARFSISATGRWF